MGETTKLIRARTRRLGTSVPDFAAKGVSAAGPTGAALGSPSLAEALVEASVDCVIAFDSDGKVVEWNPAAERTFGHRRADALGADIVDLMVPPDKRELERARLAEIAAQPPPSGTRAEREGMRANGERFPIEVTITCIRAPDLMIVCLVRDISRERIKETRQTALTSLGHAH